MSGLSPRRGRFRPRLWPTVATLLGLSILLSLGTWQFGRYLEKVDIEAQRARQVDKTPIDIHSLDEFEERSGPFRHVRLHGRLDPDFHLLFKHRTHEAKPGYWLGGVLRFERGEGAVLVNRGWVHRRRGDEFATDPPESGTQVFEGLVNVPRDIIADEDKRRKLQAGKLALDEGVSQWDTYDLAAISDALPYETPADPTIVVLGPDHSGDPYPVASYDYITEPYLTSERHLSYAVFWYTTALALIAMYLANAFGYLGAWRRRPTSAE